MLIEKDEAQQRQEKLEKSLGNLQLALSSQAFLMLKKGQTFMATEFTLIWNGKYLQREGLQCRGNIPITEEGLFLLHFNNGKLLAPRADGMFEYASSKKALSMDFSLVLSMRCCERLILIVADGRFSTQPYFVVLADTLENEQFGKALMKFVINADNGELEKLLMPEDKDSGEET